MKKTLLSIFAIIAITQINAQSLTSTTHAFVTGESYSVKTYDSTSTLPLTSGTNQTWDFSGNKLVEKSPSSISFSAPATNSGAPTGTNLVENHSGKLTYYKKSADKIEILGYNDYTSSFTLAEDSALIYRTWPISLGTREAEYHKGTYMTSIQNFPSNGAITPKNSFNAIGTGTLIGPDGTNYTNILLIIDTFNYDIMNNNQVNISSSSQQIIGFKFYSTTNRYPIMAVYHTISTVSVYNIAQKQMVYWEQTPTYQVEYFQSSTSSNTNSLGNLTKNFIQVYPNPANNKVNIEIEGVKTLKIYNLTGEILIETEQQNQIDISSIPVGLYHIEATDLEGNSYRTKFIKE